ncbi:hypothetical protein [Saccharopolyspora phatthalungensis]|uniref:Uncharacterized protein n=1 Tax=Saccharopolyspora phatthalungensis TaxID=664693 RepID=A0A840Q9Y8_9PSEU|nr:hypothetical protein [Saccharopolyspora phatthalungensis]MBB5155255.1 hypothetical protein [Saccharopolyspora phatthalungensis]
MRPWTTRTVQAAVVAAGFAAVGTGAASASENAEIPKPDLSSVPDDVGFLAPVNACQAQDGPGYGPTKAPCADTQLHANTPNLVKKVGADITTTAYGVGGELQDGRPMLTPGKPNRVLGHVFAETTRAAQLTKTRPTVGGSVIPDHLGVVTERVPDAALLNTEVGPRQPGHQGTSALDTAIDLTAAQGYDTAPLTDPVGMVAPTLANNPLQTSGEPMTLPQPEKILPATGKLPATPRLDNSVSATAKDVARQVAGSVPQAPVHRVTGQLPATDSVTGVLG